MAMVMEMKESQGTASLRDKGEFLCMYASTLYSCGATAMRIDKNLQRIAGCWQCSADFSVSPTCVLVTLTDGDGGSFTMSRSIPKDKINFDTITRLSALSWEIHDKGLGIPQARERYEETVARKRMNPWLVCVLASAANASFCELFGGDWIAILIVFVATLDGFFLKSILPKYGIDHRIAIIAGCTVSAIIACTGFVFGISGTPEVALATSVLYCVPGIPFANGISDMLYGHHLSSLSRMRNALIITVCLSIGLCLAFVALNIKFV